MTSIGLWELAVLALLREAEMHPYEMQRLLKERHTDELLPLKRGSLYHAIRRLEASGFIEVVSTTREGRRPERTTYRLAKTGETELLERLRAAIATPGPGSSDFMACVSFLVYLDPDDARQQLEARARKLDADIDRHKGGMRELAERIGRIHLVEVEYWLAMQRAEVAWVRGIVEDIRNGQLHWDLSRILDEARLARSKPEV